MRGKKFGVWKVKQEMIRRSYIQPDLLWKGETGYLFYLLVQPSKSQKGIDPLAA
jgi:hypothetical protein